MGKKALVCRLSRSKAPKTQKICHYRHTRKTGELFLLFNTGVDFSLRNNFAYAGSFAKVSVPVYICISLYRFYSMMQYHMSITHYTTWYLL